MAANGVFESRDIREENVAGSCYGLLAYAELGWEMGSKTHYDK